MPTYDYECSNGHRFDYLQSITAEPLTECVTCGEPVRRLIGGGAGIIFKGSGFYVTDSKNGNRDKKESAQDTDGKSDTAKDKAKDKASSSDAKSGADSSSSSGGDKPAKTAAAN